MALYKYCLLGDPMLKLRNNQVCCAEKMHRLCCYNMLKVNDICWDNVFGNSVAIKHLIFFLNT